MRSEEAQSQASVQSCSFSCTPLCGLKFFYMTQMWVKFTQDVSYVIQSAVFCLCVVRLICVHVKE